MKKLTIALFAAIGLFSCEKVIDVDLNSSDPKLVVEGTILEDSTCKVRLSLTSNYFDSDTGNAVTSAILTLIPSVGTPEVLTHVGDGFYEGSALVGEAGRSYMLRIDYNGEQYEATSTLYPAPTIDSLIPQANIFGSFSDFWVAIQFQDNPITEDYYRLHYVKNGEPRNEPYEIWLIDDDVANGSNQIETFSGYVRYESGDTAVLEVYQIDKGVYDYFNTLQDVMSNSGFGGSTPYNPASNVSNDALGYFGAWAISRDTLIVP